MLTRYDAYTLKKTDPSDFLLHYFITRPSFKNPYDTFETLWTKWSQILLTCDKRPLVAELKLKESHIEQLSMFPISALIQISNLNTLLAYMTTLPRSTVQIFERWLSYKIITQNMSGGSDLSVFLHHTQQGLLRRKCMFPYDSMIDYHLCTMLFGLKSSQIF